MNFKIKKTNNYTTILDIRNFTKRMTNAAFASVRKAFVHFGIYECYIANAVLK